ncbi:MAG: hypothetical protein CMD26_03205 [Flavobacteriales bacterium]|nr:hypothetical protein [Flavobacteriales bacterium]
MRRIILIILLFSFQLSFGQGDRGYIINVGDKAPTFQVKNNNDEIFNLKQHLGKIIMIQFTASWCSVCIKEMPYIEKEIWQKYKNNDDFILIALAKDTEKRPQKKKEIQNMIDKTNVTYPIMTDHDSQIFELFAEEKAGVTRNIIIDQNGHIAFLTRLFEHTEFNEMKSNIDQLLKKKH